jgi:hypothetical protein
MSNPEIVHTIIDHTQYDAPEYLRHLAALIRNIPATYGVDENDVMRLEMWADNLDRLCVEALFGPVVNDIWTI